MQLINLTPHAVDILCEGEKARTIEPSGTVARVQQEWTRQEDINGIPVYRVQQYGVKNLPAPQEDTVYIVSTAVDALVNRPDVYSPGRKKRDQSGQVYGCEGLKQIEKP